MQRLASHYALFQAASSTFVDNRGSYYYQTIVTVKEMQQEMSAGASSLSDEISKSGHLAVYGIHFETGNSLSSRIRRTHWAKL